MSYQTPITVHDAVESIRRSEFVLPAIQREFIWKPDQIARLFDSLMRGYPIGGFLFWKVDSDHCDDYKFYKFLDEYHEHDNRHNARFDTAGDAGVTAILDGQQRLTSLYIGLRGSYAYKTKHKRWNSPGAFPARRLYLNLRAPRSEDDVDLRYDFQFLTDDEAKRDGRHWFLVGDVLRFKKPQHMNQYLRRHDLLQDEYAEECLYGLHDAICTKGLINYYLEKDQDIEKVLNIFIRVNSGGTPLDYSDLLLSIATAQWVDLDARDEIHRLVDELNQIDQISGGFGLSKDLVLKSCLVLSDTADIAYKVSNFTRENTARIEKQWGRISEALTLAVRLVARFGYNRTTLTSYNALIPIAYYILRKGIPAGFDKRREFKEDRVAIQTWIARALLDGTFGGSSDTTLKLAREAVREASNSAKTRDAMQFPAKQLDKALRLGFQDDDLEEFLDLRYGAKTTFSVLALLYPSADFSNHFHIDHIFPRARLTRAALRGIGIADSDVEEFQDRKDRIANLQLLEGFINQEKSAEMPSRWLARYRTDEERDRWLERNFLTDLADVPEGVKDFFTFYDRRRERMKRKLSEVLGLTS